MTYILKKNDYFLTSTQCLKSLHNTYAILIVLTVYASSIFLSNGVTTGKVEKEEGKSYTSKKRLRRKKKITVVVIKLVGSMFGTSVEIVERERERRKGDECYGDEKLGRSKNKGINRTTLFQVDVDVPFHYDTLFLSYNPTPMITSKPMKTAIIM